MSIRLDTSTDYLRGLLGTAFSGTGPITISCWVKPITDPNAERTFWHFFNASTGSGFGVGTNGGGDFIHGLSNGVGIGDYSFTNGTWYHTVMSRDNGVNARWRVFPDSLTTTPLEEATLANSTNYSAVDDIYIGHDGDVTSSYDFEVESFKVHIGVEWSNTECATERAKYLVQTSGGSATYAVRLSDIDTDTDGIVEAASSFTMTNSGCVNGASRPSVLEAVGGGGSSGGLYVKSNRLYSFPTYRRSL